MKWQQDLLQAGERSAFNAPGTRPFQPFTVVSQFSGKYYLWFHTVPLPGCGWNKIEACCAKLNLIIIKTILFVLRNSLLVVSSSPLLLLCYFHQKWKNGQQRKEDAVHLLFLDRLWHLLWKMSIRSGKNWQWNSK